MMHKTKKNTSRRFRGSICLFLEFFCSEECETLKRLGNRAQFNGAGGSTMKNLDKPGADLLKSF